VRRWLLARVVAHPDAGHPEVSGWAGVVDRQRLDPVLLRELLYQDRRWSSPQIAAHLDCTVKTVLRTLHDHGIGGPPRRSAAPPDTRRRPAVDRPV